MAEGIDESGGEQVGELRALLIGETGAVVVGLGVLQVDLLMSDVQISAQDDGFDLIQLTQVSTEGIFPRHAVGQAGQFLLGIGRVTAHEVEFLKFHGDDTALGVVLRDADAVFHGNRRDAGEDGRAGIALLFGVVPVALIAGQHKVGLTGLQFGLLQADDVGVEGEYALGKALVDDGAEAVYVPGNQFHVCIPHFL